MKAILDKLRNVFISLEKENGPISFFALFLREKPLEKWDLVISATWLHSSDMSSFNLVSTALKKALDSNEFEKIARIVIIDRDDPVAAFFQANISVKNDQFERMSGELFSERFGFVIKKAYILRCA